MRIVTITWVVFSLAVFALAATACGTSRQTGRSVSAVSVQEKDFRITLRPDRVAAGRVDLRVAEDGPADHELILVHARPGGLPVRTDGLTVDENALEPYTVGALEPAPPGTTRHLLVTLPKGRYEVFCNMAGHYMGGMHAFLVVT